MNGAAIGWLSPVAGTPWLLWIEFSRGELLGPAHVLLQRMLALALACIALAALLVGVVSARITTPLHALTLASEAIVAGDYAVPVTSHRRDEIGRLSAAFNTMSAHVRASREELEARVQQRTEALERAVKELEAFSYSVSHDLRAPLRAMTGSRASCSTSISRSSPRGGGYLQRVSDNAQQMGRLVDDLLAFSRLGRAARPARVDIEPARSRERRWPSSQPEHAGRAGRISVGGDAAVPGRPALLKQVWRTC